MGQAKLRGSRDERVAQAVAKAEDDREAAAIAKAESEQRKAAEVAAMSPQERERYVQQRTHSRARSVNLVGLMLALAALNRDHALTDQGRAGERT